jgi:hypothetical protein
MLLILFFYHHWPLLLVIMLFQIMILKDRGYRLSYFNLRLVTHLLGVILLVLKGGDWIYKILVHI